MFSFKSIVLTAVAFAIGAESSAVPAIAAAPLIAPATVGYAHAVPQNISPYAAQVNVFNKALSPLVAAPLAAPYAAPIATGYASPFVAPYAAPAPYFAGAGPYAAPYALPAGYPTAYAAPFPYTAAAVRAPLGLTPAFVR